MARERTVVYRGKIIDLYREEVELPNGVSAEFEIVQHPGGAAAVAVDNASQVCLLRQYRHAVGAWLWELPAGKLDPGEAPQFTAQRELEEEAGLRAGRWQSLGKTISSPGVFTEVVHLFLARDLSSVGANVEAQEIIEVHWLPFSQAIALAQNGEIVDGKTLIGLFRAAPLLGMPSMTSCYQDN